MPVCSVNLCTLYSTGEYNCCVCSLHNAPRGYFHVWIVFLRVKPRIFDKIHVKSKLKIKIKVIETTKEKFIVQDNLNFNKNIWFFLLVADVAPHFRMKLSKKIVYCSQIHCPCWGDKVVSVIGLSYRPASLSSMAGRCDNPMRQLYPPVRVYEFGYRTTLSCWYTSISKEEHVFAVLGIISSTSTPLSANIGKSSTCRTKTRNPREEKEAAIMPELTMRGRREMLEGD
jgi:hypothetical protein